MNVGHLFVLFGLNVQSQTFRHGLHLLASVHMAASSVISTMSSLAHGVVSLTDHLSEEATHIHSLSQAMGMNIEQAQRWGYVAEQSGSNLKELSIGVSMLQGNLRKLAIGDASPRLLASFRALKTTRDEAKEAMKGPEGLETVMLRMADRFKELGVSGEASTLARLSLGARAGRALQADMIRGSAVLQQMFKRLDDIGGTIKGDDIIALQSDVFDLTNDIKKAWHGVASTILAEAAPAIKEVLNDIALWFGQNRDLIKTVLLAVVNQLIVAFKVLLAIVNVVGDLIRGLMRGELGPVLLFSAIVTGIVAVVAVIIELLIPVIGMIGVALNVAFAGILPFVIAFGAILTILILILTHLDKFGEFVGAIGEGLRKLGRVFMDIGRSIADGFMSAMSAVGDAIETAFNVAKDKIFSILDDILTYTVKLVNDAIGLLNYLPYVDLDEVEAPDWFKPVVKSAKKQQSGVPGTSANSSYDEPTENTANVPSVTIGVPSGQSASARSVNVAPTTVNIYGVKDAKEASGHIADAIDQQNRHAAAALGGEVV